MSQTSFPVVRGNMMRITKVDGCGKPVAGAGNMIATEGFVSVALSSNITDAEEITVTSASGKVCVRDTGVPTFDGYGVDIEFCEVEPCLFSLLTGQQPLTDASGNVVGFTMNSKRYGASGFALEVWTGSPASGDQCDGGTGTAQPAGYFVLPFVKGGVLGDFTLENAAVTFGVQGGTTRDGNNWGQGPYTGAFSGNPDVTPNPSDVGPYLDTDLDKDDHLGVAFTTKGFPKDSDGCVALTVQPAAKAHTGALGANDVAGFDSNTFAQAASTPTLTIKRNVGADGQAASAANPAVFPTNGTVKVHWGDGTTDEIKTTATTATKAAPYAKAGTYDVTVEVPAGVDIHYTITVT